MIFFWKCTLPKFLWFVDPLWFQVQSILGFSFPGFHCELGNIRVKAMNVLLGTYCGVLPKFYLFSQSNQIGVSFSSAKSAELMYFSTLFQIITGNILQNQDNTFKNVSIVDENVSRTSNFRGTIIIVGPNILVHEWTFLSLPGSVLKMNTQLHCWDDYFYEVHVLLGYGNHGKLADRHKCPCNSFSKIDGSKICLNLQKIYPTFVITMTLTSQTRTEISKLFMNAILTAQHATKIQNKEILFQNYQIKGGQNVFHIEMGIKTYQVHELQVDGGQFIQLSLESNISVKYKMHFCGIVGFFILEPSVSGLSYGPYCNLTDSDLLNKQSYSFYSHSKSLQMVTFNFRPDLEPSIGIVLKAIKSKCQGVTNVCFAFSARTPEM